MKKSGQRRRRRRIELPTHSSILVSLLAAILVSQQTQVAAQGWLLSPNPSSSSSSSGSPLFQQQQPLAQPKGQFDQVPLPPLLAFHPTPLNHGTDTSLHSRRKRGPSGTGAASGIGSHHDALTRYYRHVSESFHRRDGAGACIPVANGGSTNMLGTTPSPAAAPAAAAPPPPSMGSGASGWQMKTRSLLDGLLGTLGLLPPPSTPPQSVQQPPQTPQLPPCPNPPLDQDPQGPNPSFSPPPIPSMPPIPPIPSIPPLPPIPSMPPMPPFPSPPFGPDVPILKWASNPHFEDLDEFKVLYFSSGKDNFKVLPQGLPAEAFSNTPPPPPSPPPPPPPSGNGVDGQDAQSADGGNANGQNGQDGGNASSQDAIGQDGTNVPDQEHDEDEEAGEQGEQGSEWEESGQPFTFKVNSTGSNPTKGGKAASGSGSGVGVAAAGVANGAGPLAVKLNDTISSHVTMTQQVVNQTHIPQPSSIASHGVKQKHTTTTAVAAALLPKNTNRKNTKETTTPDTLTSAALSPVSKMASSLNTTSSHGSFPSMPNQAEGVNQTSNSQTDPDQLESYRSALGRNHQLQAKDTEGVSSQNETLQKRHKHPKTKTKTKATKSKTKSSKAPLSSSSSSTAPSLSVKPNQLQQQVPQVQSQPPQQQQQQQRVTQKGTTAPTHRPVSPVGQPVPVPMVNAPAQPQPQKQPKPNGNANQLNTAIPNDGKSVISVLYPKGSSNPGSEPVGGAQFYGQTPIDLTAHKTVTLEYSLFFPVSFDFVKGGKLPGLYGGRESCSGGDEAADCWSARLMWRPEGEGELYLYVPQHLQDPSICLIPPQTLCNADYGISIGRGSFKFQRGQWNHISQTITLNTNSTLPSSPPPVPAPVPAAPVGAAATADPIQPDLHKDGTFEIKINNQPVIRFDKVYYPSGHKGLFFSTFFGGHGDDWASPIDQYTYFRDFAVYVPT